MNSTGFYQPRSFWNDLNICVSSLSLRHQTITRPNLGLKEKAQISKGALWSSFPLLGGSVRTHCCWPRQVTTLTCLTLQPLSPLTTHCGEKGVLSVLYVNGFITFEASTLYQLKSLPRMACDCSSSVNWTMIQTIVFPHICCRMGRPRSTFHRLWRSLVHFFQAWIVRLLRFVMGSYANLPPRTRTCPALEALVPPGPAPPPQTARGPGGGMLLASEEASLRPLKL